MAPGPGSTWKDAEVARRFLDERRRAVPLGDEQVAILLRLARRFVPQPGRVADLGCGDGFLARAVLSQFPTAHALLIDHSEPMLGRAREAMRPFSGRCEIRHGAGVPERVRRLQVDEVRDRLQRGRQLLIGQRSVETGLSCQDVPAGR